MKFKKAFIVFLILFAAVFVLLFELGKNTLWGWLLLAALFIAFFVLYGKVLNEKGRLVRLGAWIAFLAAAAGLMLVSGPRERAIPAVDVKNPAATDVVTVAEGKLTGVFTEAGDVEVYAGIPYAAPPVGDLRWKEPQPAESWEGVRVCDTFAPASMQQRTAPFMDSLMRLAAYGTYRWFDTSDNYIDPVSEDSLYLNIWKPAGDVSGLPVLFFIHGGSLTGGQTWYSEYNGEALAHKGIIVVNCAYRLKWVNDNISAFGGDPAKITVAGESAGASSVNALCVSPLARGLFRYAIAESSGITAKKPYHTFRALADALDMGKKIMAEFGTESLADLRAVPAEELVNTRYTNSAMTVDGYAIAEQPYLTYEKGENNEQALLNGFNAHEADVFTFMRKVTAENYGEAIGSVLGDYAAEGAALVPPAPMDKAYRLPIVEQGGDAKGSYDAWISAAWFTYSHFNWSRLLAAQGKPVYEYNFTKYNKGLAANHGGEMPYAYGNLDRHAWLYTDADRALSETMQNYWVNFVKTGDPNGEGLPQWTSFNDAPDKVLTLGDTVCMTDDGRLALYDVIDKYQNQ